jgi:hypothetical protein
MNDFTHPTGHEEDLRPTRGDAAGVELGTSLADRVTVNVGSDPLLPYPLLGGGRRVVRGRRVMADYP